MSVTTTKLDVQEIDQASVVSAIKEFAELKSLKISRDQNLHLQEFILYDVEPANAICDYMGLSRRNNREDIRAILIKYNL